MVSKIYQTESENKFLTHENVEMDTNFIQIGHIFFEIMQIIFSPFGGGISQISPQKS